MVEDNELLLGKVYVLGLVLVFVDQMDTRIGGTGKGMTKLAVVEVIAALVESFLKILFVPFRPVVSFRDTIIELLPGVGTKGVIILGLRRLRRAIYVDCISNIGDKVVVTRVLYYNHCLASEGHTAFPIRYV